MPLRRYSNGSRFWVGNDAGSFVNLLVLNPQSDSTAPTAATSSPLTVDNTNNNSTLDAGETITTVFGSGECR